MLGACASSPKKDDVAQRLAVQEQVDEHMAAADKALQAGQMDKAIDQLDAAIKVDPAAKAPWLRKAQIHFDAREYGQAITQAQEVLQRDVHDLTAKSILAVSGLRVSAAALEQLRKANEVSGSARSEAESVARVIREALGEPILVPAAASSVEVAKPAAPVRSAARPVQSRTSVSSGAAVSAASAAPPQSRSAAAAGGSGRNNPFGALQ
ncbi:MAG: hypothetical protein QM742_10340 [Aquabacterium sp.]